MLMAASHAGSDLVWGATWIEFLEALQVILEFGTKPD